MSDWLELELAHQLGPVEAPAELWCRIVAPRPLPVRRRWMPLAAALALAAAGGAFWLLRSPGLDMRQLAAEQLTGSRPLQFASADPAAINRWLRAQTGLDACIPPTKVHLKGARIIRSHGVPVGEVAYRSGSQDVVLLVASADSVRAGDRHGQLVWKSGGLAFALAYSNAADPKAACLLCHTL